MSKATNATLPAAPLSAATLAAHLARTHPRIAIDECAADAVEIVRLAGLPKTKTSTSKLQRATQKYRADIVRDAVSQGSVQLCFSGAQYRDSAGSAYMLLA